jgi:hypothetical protein
MPKKDATEPRYSPARKSSRKASSSRVPRGRVTDTDGLAQKTKLQSLLTAGDPSSVVMAVALLESLEVSKRSWEHIFSDSTLRHIVSSWDVRVFSALAKSLDQKPSVLRRFERACHAHYQALSDVKKRAFLDAAVSGLDGLSERLLRPLFSSFQAPNTWNKRLDLSRHKTLSDLAADLISRLPCGVDLQGVLGLTATVAAKLGMHEGYLNLAGLSTMPDAVAHELSKHRGWLTLTGVKSLADQAARYLRNARGMLFFEHLHLTDRQAELLSQCKCRVMVFEPSGPGRSRVQKVARRYAFIHRGNFGDGGKASFDTEESMRAYNRVEFEAPSITVAEAAKLLDCRGFININVWRLTDQVADVLSTHASGLGISCPKLSDNAAASLARTKGPLVTDLPNSNSRNRSPAVMSRSAARRLARHHDYVAMGRERDLMQASE